MIKHVSVLGAGTMGNGIAHLFALKDYHVALIDTASDSLKRGLNQIEKNLDRQEKKGTINGEDKIRALHNIKTFTSYEEALTATDLVIEAATETESVKLDIFRRLDTLCRPDVILASNTSSISITKIGSVTKRPSQVIGMHFMNPVPLMKLVEVIRGFDTSDVVTKKIIALSIALDKTPVEVNDFPGFVANRILMPMINESIISLQEDVAGVVEIDTVMKLGMAHPMGPLELADFIGLDVCLSILKVLHQGFGNSKYAPSPLLINMVSAGHLGVKTGQGFYSYDPSTKEKKVASQFVK